MKMSMHIRRGLIGAVIGSLLGYAYYHFVGCSNGNSCPITSSPLKMIVFGTIFGILFSIEDKKKDKKKS